MVELFIIVERFGQVANVLDGYCCFCCCLGNRKLDENENTSIFVDMLRLRVILNNTFGFHCIIIKQICSSSVIVTVVQTSRA